MKKISLKVFRRMKLYGVDVEVPVTGWFKYESA